ncbi:hypothetical protein C8R44DRAFT_769816, partial [Mycena epipterygia]
SSEFAPDPRPASPSRTRSLDGTTSLPSTGQIAESAFSNLQHTSDIEDRLCATLTIGEASNKSTPAVSSRVSPAPPSMDRHGEDPVPEPELSIQPMSPASTPFPESRVSSPIELHEPAPVLVAPPPSEPVAPASPKPTSPQVDQVSATTRPDWTSSSRRATRLWRAPPPGPIHSRSHTLSSAACRPPASRPSSVSVTARSLMRVGLRS